MVSFDFCDGDGDFAEPISTGPLGSAFVRPSSGFSVPASAKGFLKHILGRRGAEKLCSRVRAVQDQRCERPKNGHEAPKGAQQTPQIVPNLSQMEPRTLPNSTFKRCGCKKFNLHLKGGGRSKRVTLDLQCMTPTKMKGAHMSPNKIPEGIIF